MAKEVRKTYRMTEAQAKLLAKQAEEAGMSEAEYIVFSFHKSQWTILRFARKCIR